MSRISPKNKNDMFFEEYGILPDDVLNLKKGTELGAIKRLNKHLIEIADISQKPKQSILDLIEVIQRCYQRQAISNQNRKIIKDTISDIQGYGSDIINIIDQIIDESDRNIYGDDTTLAKRKIVELFKIFELLEKQLDNIDSVKKLAINYSSIEHKIIQIIEDIQRLDDILNELKNLFN